MAFKLYMSEFWPCITWPDLTSSDLSVYGQDAPSYFKENLGASNGEETWYRTIQNLVDYLKNENVQKY